jgi:hypothetical protein
MNFTEEILIEIRNQLFVITEILERSHPKKEEPVMEVSPRSSMEPQCLDHGRLQKVVVRDGKYVTLDISCKNCSQFTNMYVCRYHNRMTTEDNACVSWREEND